MTIQKSTLFPGPGEMRARMRAFAWENTAVGPVESWPQSLKSTVQTLLGSRYPMILLWGEDLAQIYNDAYTGLIGDKHPGALGRSIRETQFESWAVIGPMITEVMTTGVPIWVEDQMLAVNRAGYTEEAHFSLSYSAVEDDANVIRGMLCVCSEVTKQVLGERRLRLQRDLAARAGETRSVENTCHDILTAMTDYPLDVPFARIYLRDPDGKTLRLCGGIQDHEPDHTAIAPPTVQLDNPDASGGIWPFAAVLTGQPTLVEHLDQYLTVSGGPWNDRVHQAIALPIPSSNASVPLGVLIAGISPNRALDESYQSFYELVAGQVSVSIRNAQAYEEERRRAEMLAEIDRAKTTFFSNVSHEFRTPLTLMLGPLEEVLQSQKLPATEREQITIAHRNSLRLLKLVNTLLDFSRLEAGRIQAVYTPTDLAALTADLASVFRSALEKAGLQLIVDCPSLPELAYVDRDMWEKIVLNLLSNAFKFTQQGKIAVRLRAVDDAIELQVSDTGIGIPPAELGNVFKRFHRIEDNQGRTYEGSGIGLALVQELVKLHGGQVQVQSVYGQGSTFTITLPQGQQHLPVSQIGSSASLGSTSIRADAFVEESLQWLSNEMPTEHRLAPLAAEPQAAPTEVRSRILLADDNADMREYVWKLLSDQYDVMAVADGAAALAAAQKRPPDLVLSDVMMPKLDGFGLLTQLRQDPRTRSIPVVLLSARAGEESRVEGLEAGADDYLVKPFSARELLARVKATLEMARLRQAAAHSRAESEAAKERATILERVTDAFYGLDRQWRFTYVNQRCEEYLNKTRDQLLGKVVWEMFPMVKGTAFEVEYHRAVQEQVAVHFEVFSPLSLTWVEVHAYPSPDGLSVNFRDITDRQQAQQEREQLLERERVARAEAEAANRIKDEFLAVLSHELRSPLNPILGWSRLLRSRSLDAAMTERALETIERNAKLQSQLVEDLLDVSRILRGKLSLTIAPVNLELTIQEALETVQLAAEAKSIHIHTVIAPGMPSILGDANRLQQVMWNLLSNAVKFTPTGGRVEVRLERVERQSDSLLLPPALGCSAQITVTDTGKGIPAEFLPYVFEYFRQADSTTTRTFGGLGLGLAIVRQVVELHGGTVQAESPGEGQGATFTVRLPVLKGETQQVQASLSPASMYASLHQVRILVVENEPDTRNFLVFLLEQTGATVTPVASAGEALETLKQTPADVLLSDISMPDMDGYALIRTIRSMPAEQGGTIPAIAITAHAGDLNEQQTQQAGFQHHIAKPVEPNQVIEAISVLVNRT